MSYILSRINRDFEPIITVRSRATGADWPLTGTIAVRLYQFGTATHFLEATLANTKIASITGSVITLAIPAADLATIDPGYGSLEILNTSSGSDVIASAHVRFANAGDALPDSWTSETTVYSNDIQMLVNSGFDSASEALIMAAMEASESMTLHWRGAYSVATAYVARDMAQHNGSAWLCISPSTGNAPPTLPTTSNTWWELHASKGDTGATGAASTVPGPTGSLTVGSPATVSFASGDMLLISDASDSGNVKKLDPIGIGYVPTASSITVYVSPDSTTATANGDAYYGGSGIQAAIDFLAGYRATGSATLSVVLRNGTYTVSGLVLRHPQPNVLKLVAQNLPTLPASTSYTSDANANRTAMLSAWNVKISGTVNIPAGCIINQVRGILFDATYAYGQSFIVNGVLTDFARCGVDGGYHGLSVIGGTIAGTTEANHIISAGVLIDGGGRAKFDSNLILYCAIATSPVAVTGGSSAAFNYGSVLGVSNALVVSRKSFVLITSTIITATSGSPIVATEQSMVGMIYGSLLASNNYPVYAHRSAYVDVNSVVLTDGASATVRTLYAYAGSTIVNGASCTAGTRSPVLSPAAGTVGNVNSFHL